MAGSPLQGSGHFFPHRRAVFGDPRSTLCLGTDVKGRKSLRKRTIASGGSRPSVGKSLRERQQSPAGRALLKRPAGSADKAREKRFPLPSRVFAAPWFLARSRQYDKAMPGL